MTKRRISKKIPAYFLCMVMVLATIHLPIFTKNVKAEENWIEVSTFDELKEYLKKEESNNIKLTTDISTTDGILGVSGDKYFDEYNYIYQKKYKHCLDLNGHNISVSNNNFDIGFIYLREDASLKIVNYGGKPSEIYCDFKTSYEEIDSTIFELDNNAELFLGDENSDKIHINMSASHENRYMGSDYYLYTSRYYPDIEVNIEVYDCMEFGVEDKKNVDFEINAEYGRLTIYGGVFNCCVRSDANATIYTAELPFGAYIKNITIPNESKVYIDGARQEAWRNTTKNIFVTPKTPIIKELRQYNGTVTREILVDVVFDDLLSNISKLKKNILIVDEDGTEVINQTYDAGFEIPDGIYVGLGYGKNLFRNGKTYTVTFSFIDKNDNIVEQVSKDVFINMIYDQGNCNGQITWKIVFGEGLTISGEGDMIDYTVSPFQTHQYAIDKIVIEDGITRIGNKAFEGLDQVETIIIPESVKEVGVDSFKGMTSLKTIQCSCANADLFAFAKDQGVTLEVSDHTGGTATCTTKAICSKCGAEYGNVLGHKYGQPTFAWTGFTAAKATITCENDATHKEVLDATIISAVTKEATTSAEGVKTYTAKVSFDGKDYTDTKTEVIPKLADNSKPDNQTPEAPKKGDALKDDKTGTQVKVLDPDKKEVVFVAPKDAKAKTITVPATITVNGVTYKVTKINDGAFKGNKTVTKIVLPSSITVIGKDAFNGCSKLKTITIPKNVIEIGANAFKGCASITKITLPSKVAKIGANAFNGCKKLKTLTIKTSKLTDKNVGSKAFKGINAKAKVKVPKAKLKAYKKILKKKGISGKNQKITK